MDQFVAGLFSELHALYAELDQRREQIDAARRELILDRQQLARQRRQFDEDRAALDRRDEELRRQRAGLEDQLLELSRRQTECQLAREELDRMREPLPAGAAGDDLQHLEDLRSERSALELQLEAVRERAADLADRLDDQEQQFAVERKRWQAELAELSRRLTERLESAEESQPAAAVVDPRPVVPTPTLTLNPVIDSVAAQFRLVQRDAARRRAGGK